MPSFAEMRDKAAKVGNAGVTKMQNTKDRHTSVPLKNTNWDPYSKTPPPPPAPRPNTQNRPRPAFQPPPQRNGSSAGAAPSSSPSAASAPGPPPIVRATRPSLPSASSSSSPPPPPVRPPVASRFRNPEPEPEPEEHRPTPPAPPVRKTFRPASTNVDELDWSNLSQEDKEVFFAWLDEFFSRYLGRPIPAF
ncbi:hypothetical protein B0H11DRAFT_2022135 [Mycena galericulata]|nr:hypothetical protein B0H11DRAFT_2022135 [Mycena galericulata]